MAPLTSLVRKFAVSLLLLIGPLGCGEDFDPRTTLDSYRVIGIEASPPEATPEDIVTLTAHDFAPGSGVTSYAWSVCAYSLGSIADYECADPELETSIGTDRTITLDLAQLGVRSVLEQLKGLPNADGTARDLERGVELWVKLDSNSDCKGCDPIQTVKRLRLRDSTSAANKNPVITSLDIAGDLDGDEPLMLRVTTDNAESYVDETGKRIKEEYLYTWYTTSGHTDPELTFGDVRESELVLDGKDSDDTTVFVAVRDERGGLAVESVTLAR